MTSEVVDDLLGLQELDRQAFMSEIKEFDTEWTPTLTKLVNRVITHYENHYRVESDLIKDSVQVLLLLSHVWPTYLEDAFLWVGGWRPSMAFHLLDFNPELQLGVEVNDLLDGVGMRQFKDILPSQLVRVDELQRLTIQAETELTQSLSAHQDNGGAGTSSMFTIEPAVAPPNNKHGENLQEIFEKADDLRLITLRNLVQILSPIQAVQLFIPAAQLHLKVHTWGKNREGAHAHDNNIDRRGGRGGPPHSFGEVFVICLREQQRDLEELKSAAKSYTESTQFTDELTWSLCDLIARVMSHYECYYRVKSEPVKQNVFLMLTPAWRSSLEHAFLWIGGWRPSTAFQLLYTIVGLNLESGIAELLNGSSSLMNFDELDDLSPSQLARVNELQISTIKEERKLGEALASFQETVANSEMVQFSRKSKTRDLVVKKRVELSQLTIGVIKEEKLKEIFKNADDLRMKTLRDVVETLSPIKAVHFLIAAAELHLKVHEWGMNKDADELIIDVR